MKLKHLAVCLSLILAVLLIAAAALQLADPAGPTLGADTDPLPGITGGPAVTDPSGSANTIPATTAGTLPSTTGATPPVTQPPTTQPPATEPVDPPLPPDVAVIEELIANMTLEEKVYQLFIVTPEDITGGKTMTAVNDKTRANLEKYPVGGIIFFASNLQGPDQTKTMLADLQRESVRNTGLPLFTCVDEEGGIVARIANNPAFGVPKFGNMCTIETEEEAYVVGQTMGTYLSELGFNFNFAPVADTTTDGIESHVDKRSFGNDPEKVSRCASAVTRGLMEHGVLSCFKHFPGNGSSATDPHKAFAYTGKTRQELMEHDLIPFMRAREYGVPAIMVAHITAPSLSGDNTPASLSYPVITQLLRQEFGYDGLVLTDALNMGAIVNEYGPDEAAVMALLAGNDLILMPDDFHSAVNAILEAVERGEIPEERIDESLRRIIAIKLK